MIRAGENVRFTFNSENRNSFDLDFTSIVIELASNAIYYGKI